MILGAISAQSHHEESPSYTTPANVTILALEQTLAGVTTESLPYAYQVLTLP